MSSEIEIICLDDSEDEDYSKNQEDPTPEIWCPKIENVYSEARFHPSTSCDDEIIQQDDDLFQSIADNPQLNVSTSSRDGSLLQEGIHSSRDGSILQEGIHSCRDGSLLQEGIHSSRDGSILQEGIHSSRDGSLLQEGIHSSRDGSLLQEGIHRDGSILQEGFLRPTIPVSSPSTSCCDESIHLDSSLVNCSRQIGSRKKMINQEDNIHQFIHSHLEDNGDESISDNEDGYLEQPIPEYPLINYNVEGVSTSMSDSDDCSGNQEEASFSDASGWSVFCSPNPHPTGEVDRDLSAIHSHSARIKRRGIRDSHYVQDIRTVFVRQQVKAGGVNDSWDGVRHEDPANISFPTDDHDEEMRHLAKLPIHKRQKVLKTSEPTSGKDIVNKLENDLEEFTKEMKKMKEAETVHDDDKEMRPPAKLPSHKYRTSLKVRKGSLGIEDLTSEEDIGKKLKRDLDKSAEGAEMGHNYGDGIWPLEKLVPSRKGLKVRKASLGMENHTSDINIVSKLEEDLEECSRDIRNLDEADVDLDDEKNSTYVLSSCHKEKYMKIYEELAQAKKISVDLGRKSDEEFHVRGSSFPSVNKKLEEFINSKKIFPNFKEVYTLFKDIDADENLFSSKRQLHEEAEKMFKVVGEKLKSRRLADEEDAMSAYLLGYDGSQLEDPANEDSLLEQKLQNNLKEASRYIEEVCSDVEEKQVDGESESEYSSDAEESYCSDNASNSEGIEDTEDYDYMDTMSDEEEDVEYESQRRAKVTVCETPRKDNSIDKEETDTLETLTPIDDLLKSSDDEEESESVDDDRKMTLEIPKTVSSNLKVNSSMEDDNEGESEVENFCIGDAMDKSEEPDSQLDDIIVLD